jgi:hypothetical protein
MSEFGEMMMELDRQTNAVTRQRHIDKIREILGDWHRSTCKTSAFDRDDGPCDCGAEIKARQIVEYFERVESGQ